MRTADSATAAALAHLVLHDGLCGAQSGFKGQRWWWLHPDVLSLKDGSSFLLCGCESAEPLICGFSRFRRQRRLRLQVSAYCICLEKVVLAAIVPLAGLSLQKVMGWATAKRLPCWEPKRTHAVRRVAS
jgi:hypothetical protein